MTIEKGSKVREASDCAIVARELFGDRNYCRYAIPQLKTVGQITHSVTV